MLRSKIRLAGLALIPAVILVTGHSSLGEAKGDECRTKPDGSAPAGLHWYYRVERASNRHCWYLHEQGMRVHSLINAVSRRSEIGDEPLARDDAASEQDGKALPVTGAPTSRYERSQTVAEPPAVDFTARWVDLPKSVDLNTREVVAESNGYAAERDAENAQEQLPPTWTSASAVSGEVRQSAATKTNFGSISLAGAVILALLLMSEALVRFARTSGWSLLRFHLRTGPDRRTEHFESVVNAPEAVWPTTTRVEPAPRTQTGANELRRLLQRAGTGLRPPQSFAPSRSLHRQEHASGTGAHSALARLKSRTFSGMTWAPL